MKKLRREERPPHPSWEAKKKVKEKENADSPTALQQANPRSFTCSMSMSTRTQMRAPALIELVFPQANAETRSI